VQGPSNYDIWRVSDADGPILYYPSETDDGRGAGDHIAARVRWAETTTDPDGLIAGVWAAARARLTAGDALEAEVVDLDVPAGRVGTRAAKLAAEDGAAAWLPDVLLAPEEPAPRPAEPRRPAATRATTTRKTKAAIPARPAAPRPTRSSLDVDESVPCQRCFILRHPDQLENGVCAAGCD
jgi:hypothetical protein